MPPPNDTSWPVKTNPRGPSITVAAVNGRHAHRSGPLKGKNIHVHITDFADAVVIRLADDTAPDFWLEITLMPNREDDALALARLADDGCKLVE